jgi:ZIP family zinc transporter
MKIAVGRNSEVVEKVIFCPVVIPQNTDIYKGAKKRMENIFFSLSPVLQALLATLFTWFMTALGAAVVFFGRGINQKVLDWLMGFAGGVMIAASYWSLLAPAIAIAEGRNLPAWFPAVVGFLLGGIFLRIVDQVMPHLHIGSDQPEGVKTAWRRTALLIFAITLHNIPEGLAVGVAFGAAARNLDAA